MNRTKKKTDPESGHMAWRIQSSELEAAFATKWREMNHISPNGRLIDQIVGEHCSERDRFVAASMIQWLGTNVGFAMVISSLAQVGYSVMGHTPKAHDEFVSAMKIALASEQAWVRNLESYVATTLRERQLQASRQIPPEYQQPDRQSVSGAHQADPHQAPYHRPREARSCHEVTAEQISLLPSK